MAASTTTSPMSIRLDVNVRNRLNSIATVQKRSSHALALEAIEQYVTQTEAVLKWNQEAVLAWKDYQATGLHATHDELDDWLATWGTQDERPMPSPHA